MKHVKASGLQEGALRVAESSSCAHIAGRCGLDTARARFIKIKIMTDNWRVCVCSLETRPSPSSAIIIITLTFDPYRSYGGRRPAGGRGQGAGAGGRGQG